MRIAVPVADGLLSQHFGHSKQFALIDVDPATRQITHTREIDAPPHQPGLLPPWLKERGVNLVIARGMGERAYNLFQGVQIEVLTGVPTEAPATLVRQYLDGTLVTGPNVCDH